jgi:hypothetical protein
MAGHGRPPPGSGDHAPRPAAISAGASTYEPTTARSEAVGLPARLLFEQCGQRRITIDLAAANGQVIRSCAKARSRPAGVMRQHERGSDGCRCLGAG